MFWILRPARITFSSANEFTADGNIIRLSFRLLCGGTASIDTGDFKFGKADGQYIDVAHFISDLEDDDRLNWEINNFAMNSGSGEVTATFTIKDVPIDSESFISSATAGQNNSNGNTRYDKRW